MPKPVRAALLLVVVALLAASVWVPKRHSVNFTVDDIHEQDDGTEVWTYTVGEWRVNEVYHAAGTSRWNWAWVNEADSLREVADRSGFVWRLRGTGEEPRSGWRTYWPLTLAIQALVLLVGGLAVYGMWFVPRWRRRRRSLG